MTDINIDTFTYSWNTKENPDYKNKIKEKIKNLNIENSNIIQIDIEGDVDLTLNDVSKINKICIEPLPDDIQTKISVNIDKELKNGDRKITVNARYTDNLSNEKVVKLIKDGVEVDILFKYVDSNKNRRFIGFKYGYENYIWNTFI